MKALRAKIARSQAAEVAREARSERTSRPATETTRAPTATIVMEKVTQAGTETEPDVAETDAPTPVVSPARAGGAPRRPAKRSNRGRPSGKKRR
jgi:hypothetical protein